MRKVLIVVYYWPPAGGPGVQRWLKFVKYLRDFDIEPIVFVPKNPQYPIQDQSLLDDIPKGIKIYRQMIFEPLRLATFLSRKKTKRISSGIIQKYEKQSFLERTMLWIRGNLFIPDARKYWVKPSVKRIKQILNTEKIDTVITTGPPHSVHLIGLTLKKQLNIKWVTDFRDPWTTIGYHSKLKLTSVSKRRHKAMEKEVLDHADKVVVTSAQTKLEFETLTKTPIKVITNGFDEPFKKTKLDNDFTVSHIGSLLTERNPKSLWKILAALVQENEAFRERLKIQLIGVVGNEVLDTLENLGLKSYVRHMGYLPHNEVIELQRNSQVLLLLEIDAKKTQGILPGKLFEYLNARRPILAIGPEGWEAAKIVEQTKSGMALTPQQMTDLKNVLLKWFSEFQSQGLKIQSEDIEKYSRRELTASLAKILTWELS